MKIFDIETDGLYDDVTKIHLLVIRDIVTREQRVYRNNESENTIEQGLRFLMECAAAGEMVVGGHHVIRYDIPVIRKLFPWFSLPEIAVVDTIVLARLIYPDLRKQDAILLKKGKLPKHLYKKYSLEAWGRRLDNFKGEYEGDPTIADEKERKARKWERWNPAMEAYCIQDVDTTETLYKFLMSRQPSAESVRLEHQVQWIIARQERFGVAFDEAAARRLQADLVQTLADLKRRLQEVFPPFYVRDGKLNTPKKDRLHTNPSTPQFKGNRQFGYCGGAPYQPITKVEFNPGSRDHVALMLTRRYGWEPEEFTDDGKPKIDEAVLEKLEYPEAPLLADYYLVAKRLGQVAEGDKAWLKVVKPNGRIYGKVTTNGAVTGRMTHADPNLAQCPKVKVIAGEIAKGLKGAYGFECRSCFIATPGSGRVLVGADGAALELRDLAGYMAGWDGGAYVKVVLEGKKEDGTEIHTVNRKALEIDSRDDAKTWFYAFLYGAGDEKLGLIVVKVRGQKAIKKGKELRARFLRNLPALGKLVRTVKDTAKKRGYLLGLDGRRLHVRSQHSALNTLLQSAGAVQMKQALVFLEQMLQARGFKHSEQAADFDYEFVLNVHDEWQIECKKEIADEVGKLAVAAIRRAGEHFKFPCALDGEYKIGRTWAETH